MIIEFEGKKYKVLPLERTPSNCFIFAGEELNCLENVLFWGSGSGESRYFYLTEDNSEWISIVVKGITVNELTEFENRMCELYDMIGDWKGVFECMTL